MSVPFYGEVHIQRYGVSWQPVKPQNTRFKKCNQTAPEVHNPKNDTY